MSKRHQEGKIKYDTFTGKSHSQQTIDLMSEKASKRILNSVLVG